MSPLSKWLQRASDLFFRRDDELGLSIVFRQPATPEEWRQAREAMHFCPTETIGDDGGSA